MNDRIELELRKLVERVVRPVVAVRSSKRTMREELLAHVQAVFGDECAASADEQLALQRTFDRFGEPAQTTKGLQASITRRERVSARMERYMQVMWDPGDSLGSLLLRQAAQVGFNLIILMPLMTAVALLAQRTGGVAFAIKVSVCLSLFLPMFVGAFTFIPINFGDAIFGPTTRRSRKAVVGYTVSALACLPVVGFSIYYALTGDLASSAEHGLIGLGLAPVNLFLFFVAGRLAYQQMAGDHRWTLLNLDE